MPRTWASKAAEATSAETAAAVDPAAVNRDGLANDAVTTEKIFDGTIALNDLSASAQNAFWRVDGNLGTTAGVNFLGTRDSGPLELKVGNERVLRLERGTESANLLGGSSINSIAVGATGVTIAGGGRYILGFPPALPTSNPNEAGSAANYAVIGGGYANRVDALASTVAGGNRNNVQTNADHATIGGGSFWMEEGTLCGDSALLRSSYRHRDDPQFPSDPLSPSFTVGFRIVRP